ncbi:MAG: double-strand break repair helicase AddA [Pseudomonadota bacterium]
MSAADASAAQNRAARPDRSSWVAANAGSGKTRVLTDRVARLLLHGADPSRVLCLTYTKAAAGEMQTRLFQRLGAWSMAEDAALADALAELGEATPTAERMARARTLFARALETPGGLKIQTIHAFGEALLRRFPIEAGVSPRFEVLEDRQAARLRAQVLDHLAQAPETGFAALAPHLQADAGGVDALMLAILANRDRFRADPEDPALPHGLGLRDTTPPAVAAALAPDELDELIAALVGSDGADAAVAAVALERERAAPGADLDGLAKALLTKDGTPRARVLNKAVRTAAPDCETWLNTLVDGTCAHLHHRAAAAAVAKTQALYRFARAFLAAYDAAKAAQAVLDFDDLVRLPGALLTQAEAAEWVRYKLDGGITHVLVDEAQDTSPAQWRVIDALVDEFFSDAAQAGRTLFVVGDPKQSIFSFQGAEPATFAAQQGRYATQLEALGPGLQRCELLYSFRSAAPILRLVDQVQRDGAQPRHLPFHDRMPGRVDLWPVVELPETPAEKPWHAPVDAPDPDDTRRILARRIADHLADLLHAGTVLPGMDGPLSAGDVLILVRSRGILFRALLTALTEAGVPVAGADRLRVNEQLAVRDILALLSSIATPADDLSLAAALRSPLFGLTEAELYRLAQPRGGTLAAALTGSGAHAHAAGIYADLRGQADFLRPHDLIQRLLIRHGAGTRIVARLGAEAGDAVAALLDLAIDYERVEPPTLTGFLDWMQAGDPELKRQLDAEAGDVRVMTIHGAKGLEAPLVILPDTIRGGNPAPPAPLVRVGADIAALRDRKETRAPAVAAAVDAAAAREAEEDRRLLYVAMTRAERWLIVAGAALKRPAADPWYDRIEAAMADLGAAETATGLSLHHRWDAVAAAPAPQPGDGPTPPALPVWLSTPPPPAPEPPTILSPSRDGGGYADPTPAAAQEPAPAPAGDPILRGHLLHRLLEDLPGLPRAAWPAFADALISHIGPGAPAAAELLAEATALVDDPTLSWIFAPGGLAEAGLAGISAGLGGRTLSGRIDRLVAHDGAIWAIDYKSDAAPPDPGQPLAAEYAGQLALYVLALEDILKGQPIRAAILWTRRRTLSQLPHEAVSTARRRLQPH